MESSLTTSPFTDIELERKGEETFILAKFKDQSRMRDHVSKIDLKRLNDCEITLVDLAFKHFAYVLP